LKRGARRDDLADHELVQLRDGGHEPFVSILICLGGAVFARPLFFGRQPSGTVIRTALNSRDESVMFL
jgi:hypothetical protein